jgi:hypothetical protein
MAAVPVPFPESCCLPVFKSFTSVQELPSHSSVSVLFEPGDPPKIKPSVTVPQAPPNSLCVLTLFTSVQVEPLYCSTFTVGGGKNPVATMAAV